MKTASMLLGRVGRTQGWVLKQLASDDDRTRHAWAVSALLWLGAVSGQLLLPILPVRVDRATAVAIAAGCMVLGAVLPLLPWTRLPRWALLIPVALVLPALYGLGGHHDGALDYYVLFLPLVFLFVGLAFPPVYCLWVLLTCLALTTAVFLRPQAGEVLPQVLLVTVLGTVCGTVLAIQRRSEVRGHHAMRLLVEAATSLGSTQDEPTVARLVAAVARELMRAEGAEVLLIAEEVAGGVATATAGIVDAPSPHQGGALARAVDRVAPDEDPARRLAELVIATDGPDAAVLSARSSPELVEHRRATLVVQVPGPGRVAGVVVVVRPELARHRPTVRALTLLAAETGRVLERLRHTRQLLRRSRTDPLTGLANRSALQDALDASSSGDTVVVLDLDHFKRVNDTLGHAVGDAVLRGFAAVLRSVTRPGQLAARLGGEEFAVLLPGVDDTAVDRYLTSLRSSWAAHAGGVTFSGGIAVRQPSETADDALARADRALYAAKGRGRNQDRRHEGTLIGHR